MNDEIILFYNGTMCQWYPSPFSFNGIRYNCAEQWMMAAKALFFKDFYAYEKVMKSEDPREQKAIGRKVSLFDEKAWDSVSFDVVLNGNTLKYGQNPRLLEILLSTGQRELVEASPTDCVWGVGLAEDDPKALDKNQWRGENRLGKVLMKVRALLR